jgi:amphi-Trp domain-containing protein
VADIELKRKESLTRKEAAERLSALATALAEGGKVELNLGASTVSLDVPDHVRTEFEVEIDGDEVELEFELKWSIGDAAAAPASSAEATGHAGKARRPHRGTGARSNQ